MARRFKEHQQGHSSYMPVLQVITPCNGAAARTPARAKAKIVDHLHLLGNDVTATAKNNLLALESSGFPIIKERQPSAPLVKPAAPVVSAGVKVGEINCIAKKQTPSDSVTYWIGTDATDRSTWASFTKTTSKFVFENLTSGQRYYIQYELNGVRNQQVFSDIVTYISQ